MKNKNTEIKIPGKIIIAFIIIVLIFLVIFISSLFRFPAKKYVKASLNAICYNETKEYTEITNASESEAKEAIDDDLLLQAEAYAAYFGIENLSDKSIEMLKEFSSEVYTYSKFKVKGSKKTKDGYIVTVKVKPIQFSKLSNNKIEKYIKDFNEKAENSEFLYDTDAVYEENFLKGLIKTYKNEFKNIQYGKYKKIKVEIKETANRRYEAEMTDVLNELVAFE